MNGGNVRMRRPEKLETNSSKLKDSRERAEGRIMRGIRCPHCGYYLLDVYGRGHYLLRIKCHKCKYTETIDTALFRTMRSAREKRMRYYQKRYEEAIKRCHG